MSTHDLMKEVSDHIRGQIGFEVKPQIHGNFNPGVYILAGAYHTHGHVFRDSRECIDAAVHVSSAKDLIADCIARQLLNIEEG